MAARGASGRLGGWLICCAISSQLAIGTANAQTGTLDKWRDAARTSNDVEFESSREEKKSRSDHDHSDHHDDCDEGDKFLGELALWGVTSPWWIPAAAMGDDYGRTAHFPRFPYDGVPGYLAIYTIPPNTRRLASRFDVEYAGDFDNLTRVGGRLLLESSFRLGLDAEAYQFEERLPGGQRDRLDFGDCNIVFRFAQSERMLWRSGVGFNWLDDEVDTDYGFNFTYGGDWFFAKPWVASANIDWGKIEHADLFRFRATIGVTFRRLDAFTGYEYFSLGGTSANLFLAGLRVRF